MMLHVVHEPENTSRHSIARQVRNALSNPLAAWNALRRWGLLAQYADLPYADVLRFREELRYDAEFQGHLARCLGAIPYRFPEAAELYVVIRAMKPDIVLETGVASGISSAHILRALAANGAGTLYSIDLPNVQDGSVLPDGRTSGWIVPASLRERWNLHIGDSRVLLPELLERLELVDIFLHDSDHSYENMMFEFEEALPRLVDRGLFLSDDTHLHTAWDDFCNKHNFRPGRIGHLGVTRKTARRARPASRVALGNVN